MEQKRECTGYDVARYGIVPCAICKCGKCPICEGCECKDPVETEIEKIESHAEYLNHLAYENMKDGRCE